MSLLKNLNIKGRISYNEPLSRHTTFRIGGPVDIWAEPRDEEDLNVIFGMSKTKGLPVFVIGDGSNLLASDKGVKAIAVSLKSGFAAVNIDGENILCGAGCGLQQTISGLMEQGYSGLEFMAGIPGTLGGAMKMNAGSGREGPWLSDFVEKARLISSEGIIGWKDKKELGFGYRQSNLKDLVVLEIGLRLRKMQDKRALLEDYKRFLAGKKAKQELSLPSAGCVFKNPMDCEFSAGKMIEDCGLKGKRINDAMISSRHANFIVNMGGATFKDVVDLIDLIKEEVLKKYNIRLETEVEIIK